MSENSTLLLQLPNDTQVNCQKSFAILNPCPLFISSVDMFIVQSIWLMLCAVHWGSKLVGLNSNICNHHNEAFQPQTLILPTYLRAGLWYYFWTMAPSTLEKSKVHEINVSTKRTYNLLVYNFWTINNISVLTYLIFIICGKNGKFHVEKNSGKHIVCGETMENMRYVW